MPSQIAAARNAVVTRIQTGTGYVRTLSVRSTYSDTNELSGETSISAADVIVRAIANDGPNAEQIQRSRGAIYRVIPIQIVVAGAVTNNTAANIDPLLEVVEQIHDRLSAQSGSQLSSSGHVFHFVRAEIDPIPDASKIEERYYAVFSMTAYYAQQVARLN